MACTFKHTDYQPKKAEFECFECGERDPNRFFVNWSENDSCKRLHEDDEVRCTACQLPWRGAEYIKELLHRKTRVQCSGCNGSGRVSASFSKQRNGSKADKTPTFVQAIGTIKYAYPEISEGTYLARRHKRPNSRALRVQILDYRGKEVFDCHKDFFKHHFREVVPPKWWKPEKPKTPKRCPDCKQTDVRASDGRHDWETCGKHLLRQRNALLKALKGLMEVTDVGDYNEAAYTKAEAAIQKAKGK